MSAFFTQCFAPQRPEGHPVAGLFAPCGHCRGTPAGSSAPGSGLPHQRPKTSGASSPGPHGPSLIAGVPLPSGWFQWVNPARSAGRYPSHVPLVPSRSGVELRTGCPRTPQVAPNTVTRTPNSDPNGPGGDTQTALYMRCVTPTVRENSPNAPPGDCERAPAEALTGRNQPHVHCDQRESGCGHKPTLKPHCRHAPSRSGSCTPHGARGRGRNPPGATGPIPRPVRPPAGKSVLRWAARGVL
jgi:hypothetical protein